MSNKLLEIFKEEISEQGKKQGRQYSLPIMMYLSVIAILMGTKNPIEIYQWMKNNGKRKEIAKMSNEIPAIHEGGIHHTSFTSHYAIIDKL